MLLEPRSIYRQNKPKAQSLIHEVIFTQQVVYFMSYLQVAHRLLERLRFRLLCNMFRGNIRQHDPYNQICRPILKLS
jgi:hypothetical protein